jgi:anti-sigma B factor antagonist
MPDQLVVSQTVASPEGGGWRFRCTLRQSGRDAAWIRVAGELDVATAPQLEQTLREAVVGTRRVVLDLRALTFMDCTGVGVIVQFSHRARQTGGRLALVRGPAPVDRVFVLTGTDDGLEIVDLDPIEPPVQALVHLAKRDAARSRPLSAVAEDRLDHRLRVDTAPGERG